MGKIHALATILGMLTLLEAVGEAQIFSSEFEADPVSEGWSLAQQYCQPEVWNDQGWYYQALNHEGCPSSPDGAAEVLYHSLDGHPNFFVEFRVRTDGDRSEISGGAPVLLAMGNSFGTNYHVTIASDLVRFLRDVDLPIWYIDIEPGIPHTYRIELYPDQYAFYIDGYLIDEGIPEGPFPAYDSLITWRGRSWYLPCENAWDYIRYGVTPADGSGDFDSDAATTLTDFYFVQECLTNQRVGINGGPDNDAGPGCRFTDFDADGDVDLLDLAEFQNLFSGS